jgi:AraC family transcriptional regulator
MAVGLSDHRQEYETRMHRVLEHIDRHIDQPLELDTLAAVAHFSPFHFHRVFSAWMGETLGEYLRRRRLEQAALRLVSQPNTPVLEIALSTGFGSAEAFARAFKARFGASATAWRDRERALRSSLRKHGQAKGKHGQVKRKSNQAASRSAANDGTSRTRAKEGLMQATLNVRLVDRPPVTVAYLRHIGPYGKPISDFWQQTVYPWMVTNNLLGQPRYGISHDDPAITEPSKLRYDACVEVPEGFVGAGQHLMTTIPGGKYAITPYRGTTEAIGNAWAGLLRDWLPASGMQLDSRPFFEYYSRESTFDPRTGEFTCDLCIPVTTL